MDESIYRVIKKCKGCPFHTKNGENMHLKKGRMDDIKKNLLNGENFVCHELLYLEEKSTKKMCAGAYEYLREQNKPNHIMNVYDSLNKPKVKK